jgi:hypothetical protein
MDQLATLRLVVEHDRDSPLLREDIPVLHSDNFWNQLGCPKGRQSDVAAKDYASNG